MKLVGILLMLLSIVFGVYVGVYLCFVCGVIQIVHAITALPMDGAGIAYGALRIIFAPLAGWLTAFFLFFPGLQMWARGK